MKTYHDTYDRLDYPQPMASGSRSRPAWLQEALNDDLRDPAEVPRSWRAPVLPPPSSSRSRQVPLPEPGRRRGYTIPQSRGDVRDDLDVRPHLSAHLRSARSQGNIRTPPSWTRSAGIDGRPGARPPPEGWDAQTASTASTSSKGNDKKYQRFQPVSVTLEKSSKNPFSSATVTKQYRAIVVECVDEFTYSVRLIPKTFPHLAAQFYRWNWYHGERDAAIKEGRKVHAEGKWKLVDRVHISQLARASRKVVLEGT